MEKRWPKAVERGLRELAEENPDNFQFERSMAHVHQQTEDHRRKPLMRKAASTLIPIGAVVVIVAALLLIPATYTVTVGSVVELSVNSSDMDLMKQVQQVTMDAPGLERAAIMMSPNGLAVRFAMDETSQSAAKETVENLYAGILSDYDYSITSEPVKVERGGNALAALTGGTVSINTTGMSDGEIESAIASALMGRGASAVDVDVTTSEDGEQREIRIEMEADCELGEEPCDFEIQLQDDGFNPDGGEVIHERQIEWTEEVDE
jgi:hypothetical protein